MQNRNDSLKLYWISFLFGAGWYLSVPFFAFYLINIFHIQPASVGFTLSVGYLAYILCSFKVGQLVDKFSPIVILNIASLAFVVTFVFLYFNHSYILFFLGTIILAVLRLMANTSINVLLKFHNSENFHHSYNIRFAVFNAGTGIGAVAGAGFAYYQSKDCFLYCALIYMIILYLAKSVIFKKDEVKKINHSFIKLTELLKIPLVFGIVISSIIYSAVYNQIFATFPMLMHNNSAQNKTFDYAKLLLINAILIVFFQIPLKTLTRTLSVTTLSYIGCLSAILSLIMIGSSNAISILCVAMVLFTFAEAILLPLFNVIIATKAPTHLLGSYLGCLGFSFFGSFLGSSVGGIFFQYNQQQLFFYLLAILMVVCHCIIYYVNKKIHALPTIETATHDKFIS